MNKENLVRDQELKTLFGKYTKGISKHEKEDFEESANILLNAADEIIEAKRGNKNE